MRNLKRALSLALASVMLLGMMVVGTSAASFPDVDSNDNIEAIEVLAAVKVFEGDKGTGNFRPDDKVTRNEMAVVMAKLILGTYEAESYVGSHPFTDVPSWADKYVAACYASGIISGRSATIYDGTANVTAVEAAAMMLRALGYEDLSKGAQKWDIPVAGKANEVNLFDGLTGGSTTQLTRNDVAKLALNALKTTMVKTNRSWDISVPGTIEINAPATYELHSLDVSWKDAIDGAGVPDRAGYGYIQLGEHLYKGDLELEKNTPDDFGRPTSKWSYKGKEIATTAEEPVAVFTSAFSRKELYDALGKSVVNNLAGAPAANKYTVAVIVNGDATSTGPWDNRTTISGAPNTPGFDYDMVTNLAADRTQTGKVLGENGLVTEIYLTDAYDVSTSSAGSDGKKDTVLIVVTETWLFQATADYDTSKEELKVSLVSSATPVAIPAPISSINKLTSSDLDGLDSFKEDDYILVTASTADDGTSYTVQTAVAPEIVTGQVSAYATGKSVTVDGTKYEYSRRNEAAETTGKSYSIGKVDYDLVLDPYGYVLTTQGAQGAKDYVYVREFGRNGSLTINAEYVADAFFTDGNRDTIVVDTVYQSNGTTKVTNVTAGEGLTHEGWYSYSAKGDKYTLTKMPTSISGSVKSATTSVTTNATDMVANKITAVDGKIGTSSTVYIVLKDKTVNVYTGYQSVPTVSASGATGHIATIYKTGDFAQFVFIDAGANGSVIGGNESELVFILGDNKEHERHDEDGTFYAYDAIVNGEEKVLLAKTDGLSVGLYYDPSYDSEDEDKLMQSATQVDSNTSVDTSSTGNKNYFAKSYSGAGGAMAQDGKILKIGSDQFKLADDCEIKIIEGKTVTSDVTAASLANKYKTSLTAVVYGVKDKDHIFSKLFVEINGDYPLVSTAATAASSSPSALTTNGDLTIAGYAVPITVATDDTLEKQLTTWVTAWNTNRKNATAWEAAVSADKTKVEFTLTTPGILTDDTAAKAAIGNLTVTNGTGQSITYTAATAATAASGAVTAVDNANAATDLTIFGVAVSMPDQSGGTGSGGTATALAAQLTAWLAGWEAAGTLDDNWTAAQNTDSNGIDLTYKTTGALTGTALTSVQSLTGFTNGTNASIAVNP